MIDEIKSLVEQYVLWLKEKTTLKQVGANWVQITTPYLDRHNDCLQIYTKKQNGGYIITDDGYIIDDLLNSGCKLDSLKRQELLKMTLAGFGVGKKDNALEIYATRENFAFKKHNLLQAMLAVNDLFFLASPMVASLFYEDVVAWLDLVDIRYTPKVKFTGKSGYDHMFDFVIPKSKAKPERILQTINRPNRDTAEALAFKWVDTREVRPPESKVYAILNDQSHPVPQGVIDALKNYDTSPVLWSVRGEVREELAA
ncbi:MAG TPA: hypothetical protein DHW42_03045 [Candidatus Marinimicrobia bacterium]|nr:hypothetical protein [Candidatus Neomarinimicrobiota bacterium]